MRSKSTKRKLTRSRFSSNDKKPAGYRFTRKMGKYLFAAPSKTGNKKYDAFVMSNGKYRKVASFGDKNYFHYSDRIGFYKSKNHNDPERRRRYRLRHGKDLLTAKSKAKMSAGYFSYYYLW